MGELSQLPLHVIAEILKNIRLQHIMLLADEIDIFYDTLYSGHMMYFFKHISISPGSIVSSLDSIHDTFPLLRHDDSPLLLSYLECMKEHDIYMSTECLVLSEKRRIAPIVWQGVLENVFSSFPMRCLKLLDLSGQYLSMEICEQLIPGNLPVVLELSLANTRCESYSFLRNLSTLGYIDLFNASYTKSRDPNVIVYNSSLANDVEEATRVLSLTGINLIENPDVGNRTIQNLLARSTALTVLYLDGEALNDSSFIGLRNCVNLKTLNIWFCENLTDVFLLELTYLVKLQHLKLRKGSYFSSTAISNAVQRMPLLKTLTLTELEADGSSCRALCEGSFNDLVSLVLDWCVHFTAEDIRQLSQCCTTLERLSVAGIHEVTSENLRVIEQCMPNLKILDLSGCPLPDDTFISNMAERNHLLQITDYYGVVIAD